MQRYKKWLILLLATPSILVADPKSGTPLERLQKMNKAMKTLYADADALDNYLTRTIPENHWYELLGLPLGANRAAAKDWHAILTYMLTEELKNASVGDELIATAAAYIEKMNAAQKNFEGAARTASDAFEDNSKTPYAITMSGLEDVLPWLGAVNEEQPPVLLYSPDLKRWSLLCPLMKEDFSSKNGLNLHMTTYFKLVAHPLAKTYYFKWSFKSQTVESIVRVDEPTDKFGYSYQLAQAT